MPLDNTATIKDIIAKLQSLEGINAKADLASVVGSPATEMDTIATINSIIQDAKNDLATKMADGSIGTEPLQTLVGNLSIGKKWASGSAVTGTELVVSGLDFTPTTFLFRVKSNQYNMVQQRLYINNVAIENISNYPGGESTNSSYESSAVNVSGGSSISIESIGGYFLIDNGTVTAEVGTYFRNSSAEWIAYE
jgi:hypothetical protein